MKSHSDMTRRCGTCPRPGHTMSVAEIHAATNNPDVDWGIIDCGPRGLSDTFRRRLRLWFGIVGRINQADYRTGPFLAWRICAGIHPWRETVKKWGVVDDRR